jgi:integrase
LQLPGWFAGYLHRREQSHDHGLLVAIVMRTVNIALVQHYHRNPTRVKDSATRRTLSILSAIRRGIVPLTTATTSLSESLRAAISNREGALWTLARAIAWRNRHGRLSGPRNARTRASLAATSSSSIGGSPNRLLVDFNFLIQCGVLESLGLNASDDRIHERELYPVLQSLERSDPALYAMHPPRQSERRNEGRPEYRLTTADVERLTQACPTLRQRAVLAMLTEAGFRAGAIERARVIDVWDADAGEVLDAISIEEKNSRIRRNVPSSRLRRALEEYIRGRLQPTTTTWLFPHHRNPALPSRGLVACVVRRLAAKVGLTGRISPHSFRRYVVNTAMRAGNRLENVAKWLGHANVVTTSRHYWTDDVIQLNPVIDTPEKRPGGGGEDGEDMLTEQLLDALAEVQRLRNIATAPAMVIG